MSSETIVVGIDGSPGSAHAAQWAVDEATRRGAGLVAVYAWHLPPVAYGTPGLVLPPQVEVASLGSQILHEVIDRPASEAGVEVDLRVVDGRPADALRSAAEDPAVSMVVVGKRGRGLVTGTLLGSVSHDLAHRPPGPVVIVPEPGVPGSSEGPDRIVVGVDGSTNAVTALEWAAAEARLRGDVLEAVIAWSVGTVAYPSHFPMSDAVRAGAECAAGNLLETAVSRLAEGPKVERKVLEGRAPVVLLDRARSADLLVVGTRGRGAASEIFLGSTAQACVHRAPVPVVIVPDGEVREGR